MSLLLLFPNTSQNILVNYDESLEVTLDATQLRNDIIVSGGVIYQTQVDTFIADGVAFQWALTYTPDFNAPQLPAFAAAGTQRPIAQGGSGAPAAAYVVAQLAPGYSVLAAGQDSVPGSGTVLSITYQWSQESLARVQSQSSIAAAAALPNKGVFSMAPESATGLGLAGAVAVAQTQLNLYSSAITTAKVTLPEQYTSPGLREGQSQSFISNRLGINQAMAIKALELQGAPSAVGQRRMIATLET